MNITIGNILDFLAPIVPTIILLFGGQTLINKYAIEKKKRETELDLICSIRKQQYQTIYKLYSLFAKFMELYRKINLDTTNLKEPDTRNNLLDSIIKAESQIDALILRIGCEFVNGYDQDTEKIKDMLGNLRQSVQLWRENVSKGEKLPFYKSSQKDYIRFKTTFAEVSAFMISQIHNKLNVPHIKMESVKNILIASFDNKYEDRIL